MATINKATAPEAKPAPQAGESDADVVYLGGKKMRVRHSWKPYSASPNTYSDERVLDFGSCSEEDVLRLATSSAIIKVVAKLREAANANPKFDRKLFAIVDVLKDVVNTSAARDPGANAILQARKAGMSEAVIEAMQKDLAAKAATATKK